MIERSEAIQYLHGVQRWSQTTVTGDYIRQLQLTKQLEQRAKEAAQNRKAAEEKISEAVKAIATVKEFAAKTTEAERLLVESTHAFSNKDYRGALSSATKSIEASEFAKKDKVNSIITSTEEIVNLIQDRDKDAEDILVSIGKTRSLLTEGKVSDAFSLANSSWNKADQFVNRKMADSFGRAQSLMLLAESVGLKVDGERQILSEARQSLDESQYGISTKHLRTCIDTVTDSLRRWIDSTSSGISSLRTMAQEMGINFSRPDGLLHEIEEMLRNEDYEKVLARLKVAEGESKNIVSQGILSNFESMAQETSFLKSRGVDVSKTMTQIEAGKNSIKAVDLARAIDIWKETKQTIGVADGDQLITHVSKLRPKMIIAKMLKVDMAKVLEVLDSSKIVLRKENLKKAIETVDRADALLEESLEGYREVEREFAKTKALLHQGTTYRLDLANVKRMMISSKELLTAKDFMSSASQLRAAQKELRSQIEANLATQIMRIELSSAAAMKMGADIAEENALLDDIIKTVKEGDYAVVSKIIEKCSRTIEEKARTKAMETVNTVKKFMDDYGEWMDIGRARSVLIGAISALETSKFEKAHELALNAIDDLKKEETVALTSCIEEAQKLLDLAKSLGCESVTLKEKLAKSEQLRSRANDLEAFKLTMEVTHFAESIIKDELVKNLTHLTRSISSSRKNGIEVVKEERLAEDALIEIERNEFEKARDVIENTRNSLDTTVVLHTEIYDRIVEISDLLEEAAIHGRDTSLALAFLTKTKKLFESGKYEEARGVSIACHEETEKIVAPFIAARRIPQVRDMLAISRRMKIDISPIEKLLARAEERIADRDYVDGLQNAKEAERLASEMLVKGISNEIAKSRTLLSKAKSSGVDARSTEAIIGKSENLLNEKRYNDALRAIELARNELDQSIVMERKASEQLNKAQSVITEVKSFGVGTAPAMEILRQAKTYYKLGRHGITVELAKKAMEQAAEVARSAVQDQLNSVEMNLKSMQLEGPDLDTALRIKDEVIQLLDQRRFNETGSLIRKMRDEVERVQSQKKLSSRALLELRKQIDDAHKRGLHADKVDVMFARADERMRAGAFSEAFAMAIRCSEELRSLTEMYDKRRSDLDVLKKEISELEDEGYAAKEAKELVKKAEEALNDLAFEKAILNVQRAKAATDSVVESMAKDKLKDLQTLYKTALKLKLDDKAMPSNVPKLVATRREEIRLADLAKIRDGMENLRSLLHDKLVRNELELSAKIEAAKSTGTDVGRSRVLLLKARDPIAAKKFEEAQGIMNEADSVLTEAIEKHKMFMELRLRCQSYIENAKRKGLNVDEVVRLLDEAEKKRGIDYSMALQKMEKALSLAEKDFSQ